MSIDRDRAGGTCLIFDSQIWDAYVRFNYARFKDAASGLCDFVAAFHRNDNASPPDLGGDDLVVFDDADIFDRIPHSKVGRWVIPGNAGLAFLAICAKRPGYKTYIRVEYDVLALTDPREALTRLIAAASDADLGGSFFVDGLDDWMWWDSLFAPPEAGFDMSRVRRGFFPIMSISRDFIAAYEKALAAGWRGHFEALAPTVAMHDGLSLVDFGAVHPPLTSFPQFQAHAPENVADGVCAFLHPVKSTRMYLDVKAALTK